LVDLIRGGSDRGWKIIYFLVLLAAWIIGVVDELVHAKDAWASMPEALILSGIVAALAIAAMALGLSTSRAGWY
jgi:multisubunit Na+/H+ antiporter MnhC subunit